MGRLRRSPQSASKATPIKGAEPLRAALESAGCRYTLQRAAVFDYLSQVHSHPSAEEVYLAVRQGQSRISLATVYKSLEALVEVGLANKLTYGDASARYEFRESEHYHLRDVATGEVHDLATPFDPDLLKKLDPRLSDRLAAAGFQVTGYRLEVLGRFQS